MRKNRVLFPAMETATKAENSAEDYKRLFNDIPIPMYIYDDQTFHFLAVTMPPL